LIFMGEEYGETAPFLYFVSHGNPDLVEAVRQGRRAEFAGFDWAGQPADPQAEATFSQSRLNLSLRRQGRHRMLLAFHQRLLALRTQVPALAHLSKKNMSVDVNGQQLVVRRWWHENQACLVFRFEGDPPAPPLGLPAGRWRRRIDSADECWWGRGSRVPDTLDSAGPDEPLSVDMAPDSVVLFTRMPSTD
jgi:maltooligosyltrehalose trehalohydrolase